MIPLNYDSPFPSDLFQILIRSSKKLCRWLARLDNFMSKKKKQKIVEIRKMLKYIFCKKKVENYFLIYMYIKLLFYT